MKRIGVELLAQAVMALLVAVAAGGTALVVAVPIGGALIGIAPAFHLNLMGGLLCPRGSTVIFEEGGDVVTYSGGTPSYGTALTVVCEDANGVRTVVSAEEGFGPMLGGLGLALGGYFMACFAPLFLVGVVLGGFLTHKLVGGRTARPAAGPPVRSF